MLPPHELKNKSFNKVIRGYNPIEVDEYVNFIIEKYTELYRENDELERKLKSAVTRLDEIKGDEDSIRSALVDAKRAATKIKADAEERAESIVRAARSSCNTILADFNNKIQIGKDTLSELRRDTLELKNEMFEKYSEHIRFIEALTANMDTDNIPEVSELNKKALQSLKEEIFEKYRTTADISEIVGEESSENEEAEGEPTVEFDIGASSEYSPEAEDNALSIERLPLANTQKRSFKDIAKELGSSLKRESKKEEEVIHTPDSDTAEEVAYLDFIKSVGSKNERSAKDDDFDMIFSDKTDKRRK